MSRFVIMYDIERDCKRIELETSINLFFFYKRFCNIPDCIGAPFCDEIRLIHYALTDNFILTSLTVDGD